MSKRLKEEPIGRRDFLGQAGLWTAGVAVAGSLIGLVRLPKQQVLPEASATFKLGRPEDFPVGSEKLIAARNVLVVSSAAGLAAVSLICTHLGCVVTRDASGYVCPCHGSKFDGQGEVLAGPAPRALRWLALSRAANGSLVANEGAEVEPGTFFSV